MKDRSLTSNLETESPFLVEFMMVQCFGRNLMAYLDENGKWREAYNNVELPEPARIF